MHFFKLLNTKYHSIGDDNSWGRGVAWKQSQWMTRIYDQSLVLCHLGQVMHHQPELRKENVGIK